MLKKFTIVLSISVFFITLGIPNSFAQKKEPFLIGDGIKTVRQKIKQNGYLFQVRDYKRDFGKDFFVPGKHPSDPIFEFAAKTTRPTQLQVRQDLPEKFDWRDQDGKSFIGPVRNQGQLGSCYSFGACAAAESVFNIQSNRYNENCVDFSESYIVWVLGEYYSDHFGGGNGADYDYYELTALTQWGVGSGLEGICEESDFPYQITQPGTEFQEVAEAFPLFYFDGWQRVYPLNYEDTTDVIKTAIMTYGVVDAAVYVTDAFQLYASGVYEDTYTDADASPYYYTTTNHAISLVGWDDNPPEGGGGCWILRNSWGSDWGEDGYMRIRYHSACVNMAACYLAYTPNSVHSYTGNVLQAEEGSVILSGSIKSNEQPLSYYFEYGVDGNLDQKTSEQTLSPISSQTIYQVSETLSDLSLDASYSYRLIVQSIADEDLSNADPLDEGKTLTFVFKKPEIENNTLVLYKECVQVGVRAAIDFNNLPVTCWVEYGDDGLFTQQTSTQTLNRHPIFSIPLNNLQPGTEYTYRIAANNGIGGIVRGEEQSFTTTPYILFESFEEADFYDKIEEELSDELEFEFESIDWSVEYVLNDEASYNHSRYWSLSSSGVAIPRVNPGSTFEGLHNLCFTFDQQFEFEDSFEEEIGLEGRLISPELHLSQFPQAYLHFAYALPSINGIYDELRVYYKSQDDAEWTLVSGGEFLTTTDSWKKQTLQLPDLSENYQFMFEATSNFGLGLSLDNIRVTTEQETNISPWYLY